MKKWILMGMVGLCAMSTLAEIAVTNLVVTQREGTKLVDISYDVFSTETNVVYVLLAVSNGTVAVSALSVTGDVGKWITTGAGKALVWNGGADWNGNIADLVFEIFVNDGIALCPVSKTGQTTSYRSGDDGELQAGVEWPDPRFTSITNGTDITVLDTLTGLEWIQAPHSLSGNGSSVVWNNAIDYCNNLNYAGHSDWYLPSRKELMSLVDYDHYDYALPAGHPFAGVQRNYHYWSSTSIASGTYLAWKVSMKFGYVSSVYKASSSYVWPVRGRQ